MPGRPMKRSMSIAGHPTSVSLEAAFWDGLRDIAAAKGQTVPSLVAEIDNTRGPSGLSTAIRLYVLDYFRSRVGSDLNRKSPATDQER